MQPGGERLVPWVHCDQTMTDDERCASCGISKGAWTLKLDRTRTFKIGNQFQGDGEAQTQALKEAAQQGVALAEKCEDGWIELKLVDAYGQPVPNAKFQVRLARDEVREGQTDAQGFARLDNPPFPHQWVKVRFVDYDESAWGRRGDVEHDAEPQTSPAQGGSTWQSARPAGSGSG